MRRSRLLAVAVVLQTGATSAIKAVKMSAKIVAGRAPTDPEAPAAPESLSEVGVASPEPGVASP